MRRNIFLFEVEDICFRDGIVSVNVVTSFMRFVFGIRLFLGDGWFVVRDGR